MYNHQEMSFECEEIGVSQMRMMLMHIKINKHTKKGFGVRRSWVGCSRTKRRKIRIRRPQKTHRIPVSDMFLRYVVNWEIEFGQTKQTSS